MSTLLDTNVLSELLRSIPDATVVDWFSVQPDESLFVSAVTQAEMMLGARLMPAGKRRSALAHNIAAMFEQDFAGRILPFDSAAVASYVDIVSSRRATGRPISQFDAQIAAIAQSHKLKLATRNMQDFDNCGLALVDPWQQVAPRRPR